MRWDPTQYSRYADERGRPFVELLARVPVDNPSYVVDLGCGPGNLTVLLRDRWPDAQTVGIDSSPEMIAAARDLGRDDIDFQVGDVVGWRPDGPVDVAIANAVLHWVPGHLDLVGAIARRLSSGGVFAFQVPDNFSEPSHTLLRDLRLSDRWRDLLGEGADRAAGVERPAAYLQAFADAGLEPDVWQTTYWHVLPGDDAVLEWTKGTALRPVLSLLDADDQAEFLADYAAALRGAYPRQAFGTVFEFRRTFAVGTRPATQR